MKQLNHNSALSFATAALLFAVAATFQPAQAQMFTDVDNINISSYYTANWGTSSEVSVGTANGPEIAAAPTNGNQSTGITFGDWNGNYVEVGSDGGGNSSPLTINLGGVSLAVDPVVNALFNSFYGQASDVNAAITFENNLDETVSFSLVGNQTIRDYNTNNFTNDLLGYNTNSAYGEVTAVNWWNNYSVGGGQRLDALTFTLPTSWAGTDIESMTIANPYSSYTMTDSVLLSAVQTASVPEPESFWLIVVGLLGLYSARRFRFARNA